MRIIMLSGPQKSGKTTTINMVYDGLIESYATTKEPRPFPKPEDIRDYKDFEAILVYTNKTGEKLKVALASMGDYSLEIIHYMSYYEGKGCDVLICACRNYFSYPFRRLDSRYKDNHHIITKNAPTNDDDESARDKIIDLI